MKRRDENWNLVKEGGKREGREQERKSSGRTWESAGRRRRKKSADSVASEGVDDARQRIASEWGKRGLRKLGEEREKLRAEREKLRAEREKPVERVEFDRKLRSSKFHRRSKDTSKSEVM